MADDADHLIAAQLGADLQRVTPVGGGCIHAARRMDLDDGRTLFVKSGAGHLAKLLQAEAHGLKLLSPHIRVPRLIDQRQLPDHGYWIALEWLDLTIESRASKRDLGEQLRQLHAVTSDEYGLAENNFIGTTPQDNTRSKDWTEFFIEHRIKPQWRLAAAAGFFQFDRLGRIITAIRDRLEAHSPLPALLHGDLWSGNFGSLTDGSAVVFDPAPYFGDPETDLAMMELFGPPLDPDFLQGYGDPAVGRDQRKPIYDLYHALNHVNLFGSGYQSMVERCLHRLGC
ncbi:fructosamine kinase family protein [Luteolibacter pohnpeiensis]|uniref:Fructosamine kinase family protein n=1 Tax=Luteolibacter pohnpeiensis TaxID=454153 RepID=A0A934VUL3_9BACT|nr:fructosamine kinase family protein [Luteolibacter pohnpeiensis]MBK1881255.1 fructosamine kinase family protein [Luteolibacter pohnpeiensis]